MNARLPIPRTGVVHGMSNAAYHAHEALSKSQLAKFLICPAPVRGLVPQAPRIGPGDRKPARRHPAPYARSEPDTFKDRYAVGPDVSRATKVWKEWEASIRPGVTAIKGENAEEAKAQAESMLCTPTSPSFVRRPRRGRCSVKTKKPACGFAFVQTGFTSCPKV